MDGNGRWATKRGMPRKFGHREGAKNFKDLSLYCRDIGLRNASFYVFYGELETAAGRSGRHHGFVLGLPL